MHWRRVYCLLLVPVFVVACLSSLRGDDEAAPEFSRASTALASDEETGEEKPADDGKAEASGKSKADQNPQDDSAPGDPDSEPPADAVAKWKELSARKLEIARKLSSLRERFETAGKDERKTIRTDFQGLIEEYHDEVAPRMADLAADVLAKQPENVEAAALVLRDAYNAGDYARAAKLADRILANAEESPYEQDRRMALRIGSQAHFALHDFQRTVELLEELDEVQPATAMLAPAELLPAAREYVDLWKQERELRKKEEALEGEKRLPRVRLTTERGEIVLLLFEDQAPNTVANFVTLVEEGAYDANAFHDVVQLFVRAGKLTPQPEFTIASECFRDDARMHFTGSLTMHNAGVDTGSTQFCLTRFPTHQWNPRTDEDGEPLFGHTVFGRVVKGQDVVNALEPGDRIEKAEVLFKRPGTDYAPKRNSPEPDSSQPVPPKAEKSDEPQPDAPEPKDDPK